MLRASLRLALPALVATALACGGDGDGEPEPAPPLADTTPSLAPVAPADTADVTLLRRVPDGGPMPAADRAGGIPPYPGATVHTRLPRNNPEIRSFEAFTEDSAGRVEAFYDASLGPGWTKVDAEDTTVYEKGNDEAAITVTPWDPEELPAGIDHPPVLRGARTVIGVAWRVAPDAPRTGG